jgi:hypothetical protein
MLPTRISRWLRLDLPHQIRGLGLPVADVLGADHSFTPLRLTCELLGTSGDGSQPIVDPLVASRSWVDSVRRNSRLTARAPAEPRLVS